MSEYLSATSIDATFTFAPCDPTSISQQFVYSFQNQFFNPNYPQNQTCFNGNGRKVDNVYQEVGYWYCLPTNLDEQFSIICPLGKRSCFTFRLLIFIKVAFTMKVRTYVRSASRS